MNKVGSPCWIMAPKLAGDEPGLGLSILMIDNQLDFVLNFF